MSGTRKGMHLKGGRYLFLLGGLHPGSVIQHLSRCQPGRAGTPQCSPPDLQSRTSPGFSHTATTSTRPETTVHRSWLRSRFPPFHVLFWPSPCPGILRPSVLQEEPCAPREKSSVLVDFLPVMLSRLGGLRQTQQKRCLPPVAWGWLSSNEATGNCPSQPSFLLWAQLQSMLLFLPGVEYISPARASVLLRGLQFLW